MITEAHVSSQTVSLPKVQESARMMLDELAAICKNASKSEADIARITYNLKVLGYTPSVIVQEMNARHAHSISTSWVVRLQKIYDWWVMKHGYDAYEVFRYSKNKLYKMALHGVSDWDFLVTHGDKSDRDFMLLLRDETNTVPETVILNVPFVVKEELKRLATRLSQMTGTPVGVVAALEFAVDVANCMSEDTLRALWDSAHGEANPNLN